MRLRFMNFRNVLRFSTSKIQAHVEELAEVQRKAIQTETNKKIQELLSTPDIIDYDAPNLFKGNLILCPTPIGNLKDLSFRAYEAITTADIIACEDTRMTGKLLYLLKAKKFNEMLSEVLGVEKPVGSDSPLSPEDETDENVFGDFAEKRSREITIHPHATTSRRLKHQQRDFHQQAELNETRKKAKDILTRNDSLGFLGKFEEEEELKNTKVDFNGINLITEKPVQQRANNYETDDSNFYDTHSKTRKQNQEKFTKNSFDDEFITFIKHKIYESKLKKGRGLLLSCHRFNEEQRIENLLKLMKAGLKVVLVPDAGSSCLSDPGQLLINEAIKHKIAIESLPGPNSVVLALTSSGFPAHDFSFHSFWPKNEGDTNIMIAKIKASQCTTVFFENKHRIMKTLLILERILGKRQLIFVAIEMTKLHERLLRGPISHVFDTLNKNPDYTVPSLKGELTIVLAPYTKEFNIDLVDLDASAKADQDMNLKRDFQIDLEKTIHVLNQRVDMSTKDLSEILSRIFPVSKKKLYLKIVDVKKKGFKGKDSENDESADENNKE